MKRRAGIITSSGLGVPKGSTPFLQRLGHPTRPCSPAGDGELVIFFRHTTGGCLKGCAFWRGPPKGEGQGGLPPTLRELGFLRGSAGQHFFLSLFL